MQDHELITKAAAAQFLKIPGVHGVGYGSKKVRDVRTGEGAIIVYVDRKRAPNDLSPAERIPKTFMGLPTDVVEAPRAATHEDSDKYRPIKGGCQLAESGACNCDSSYGTLGCVCLDLADSSAASILTNNHVLEDTSSGGRVYQPSAVCNCCDSCPNVIGFKTRGLYSENVDGAIAKLKSGVDYTDQIIDVGSVTGTYNLTAQDAASGTYQITKRGRTSKKTTGILASIGYNTSVDGRSMTNQIRVDAQSGSVMSQPGDSGSVYLNSANQVVGLNWGGPTDDSGSYGVGSPIAKVMSELNIDIYVASSANALRIGPPAIDPLEALAASVQSELAATARGGAIVQTFRRHQDEIWALAGTDRRLLANWRRFEGVSLYRAIVRAAQDRVSCVPYRIGEAPASEVMDRLAVALLRQGSQPLKADLLRVLPIMKEIPGLSYPEFLQRLNQSPVAPPGLVPVP